LLVDVTRDLRHRLLDRTFPLRRGSIARISYEVDRDTPTFHGFALDVETWPGGRRRLARLDGHANTMEWVS